MHLIETHTANPGKVRVGQQHAATIERTLATHRHGIAATIEREALLTGICHLVGVRVVGDPRCGLWRRGTDQGFGELTNPALDQQPTGQLDQVFWSNIANPLALALLRQALLTAFGEIVVVARGIPWTKSRTWAVCACQNVLTASGVLSQLKRHR